MGIRRIDTGSPSFKEQFAQLLSRGHMDLDQALPVVSSILESVRTQGDQALLELIRRFDGWSPENASALEIPIELMQKAYDGLTPTLKDSLHKAYERIHAFHLKQKPTSWLDFEANGSVLGQKVTPVDRAGLYIPGGKAAYPSSLLMNVIPALVAGVSEIVICTPTPSNEPNELLLAAAHLCGIKKAYRIGGAGAIAAMAYGTETIPKVDVITGPGNIYVALAKKLVFGEVNIDMIAGPSEIGILADESANPSWIAMDLLSQAEHDEMASSILITPDRSLAESVEVELEKALKNLGRQKIASASLYQRAAIIVTATLDEAVQLMNELAPEHLEILTQEPFAILPKVRHAGAIFLGGYTPEAIGDYIAGPNHTLPTGGTARFYSPLSVEHFMKKSSIIAFSQEAIATLGDACATLADMEGLDAHAKSVRLRLERQEKKV